MIALEILRYIFLKPINNIENNKITNLVLQNYGPASNANEHIHLTFIFQFDPKI